MQRETHPLASKFFKLTIVRHGITDSNAANELQGHSDPPLNSLGRWQASRLGEYFCENGIFFTAAFSSDLRRAVETTELILEKQPSSGKQVRLEKDAALRERFYGTYEGTKSAKFIADARKSGVKAEFYTPESVEPISKLCERIENWFQMCWHLGCDSDNFLVVAHGGSIRRLYAYFYDSLNCRFPADRCRADSGNDKHVIMKCEALHQTQHLSSGSGAK
uniref:Uncharacterized protein n=1 Tax=Trichuris muris TaxID=70415 RepID=A0A5S6R0T5_TRIMR